MKSKGGHFKCSASYAGCKLDIGSGIGIELCCKAVLYINPFASLQCPSAAHVRYTQWLCSVAILQWMLVGSCSKLACYCSMLIRPFCTMLSPAVEAIHQEAQKYQSQANRLMHHSQCLIYRNLDDGDSACSLRSGSVNLNC